MPDVKDIVNRSINILRFSKSLEEKKDALNQLAKYSLNAESVLDELIKIIRGKGDFVLQSLAEEVMIKIGEPAIPFLRKMLKSPSRKNRSKAVGMLGEIAANDSAIINKVLLTIKPAAKFDMNYHVRVDAINAIEKFLKKNKKSENIVELLGEIIRYDRHYLVRKAAGETIAKANFNLALDEVLKSMDRKNYPFLKISEAARVDAGNILYSLGSDDFTKLKSATPLLLSILKNDLSAQMRITVLLPLILGGGWDVAEEVLSIVIEDRWWQVRNCAIEVLGSLLIMRPDKKSIKAIIPLLKKIAREDKYENVKDSARDLLDEMNEILKMEEE